MNLPILMQYNTISTMIPQEVKGAIVMCKYLHPDNSLRRIATKIQTVFDMEIVPQTVDNILFKHCGSRHRAKNFGLREKSTGRPKKIPKIESNKLKKFVLDNRKHKRLSSKLMNKKIEKRQKCCDRTIRRTLKKDHNLSALPRRNKGCKPNRDHEKRCGVSKKILRKSDAWQERIVAIDGSNGAKPMSKKQAMNKARASLGPTVYRTPEEGLHPDCVGADRYAKGQGGKINFWGAVGVHQKTKDTKFKSMALPPKDLRPVKIVTMVGRQKTKKYKWRKNNFSVSMDIPRFVNFIGKFLVPFCQDLGFKWSKKKEKFVGSKFPLLLGDNEWCMHSKPANDALRRRGIRWFRIPPGSADLNPIETCWAKTKDILFDADGFPPKIEQRNEFIKRWHSAVKSVNRKGINNYGPMSMKKRAKKVLEVGGAMSTW